MTVVVGDAGPLISFEKIPDGFSLLKRLVRAVLIPTQVLDELTAGVPAGVSYLGRYGLWDLVEVKTA